MNDVIKHNAVSCEERFGIPMLTDAYDPGNTENSLSEHVYSLYRQSTASCLLQHQLLRDPGSLDVVSQRAQVQVTDQHVHLKSKRCRPFSERVGPRIDHFLVPDSVTWPLNSSEAGGLIQTSLPLLYKSSCSYAN